MPGAAEFLEALPDGALVLVAGGTITAANAQAEDMLQLRLTGLNAFTVIRLPAFVEAVHDLSRPYHS